MTITKMVKGLKDKPAVIKQENKKRTLQDLPMFKIAPERVDSQAEKKDKLTEAVSASNERLAEFKFTGEGVKRSRLSAAGTTVSQ